MISQELKTYVQGEIAKAQKDALYSTKNVAAHTHNGIDSPKIDTSSSINASGPGTTTTVSASFVPTKIPISSATFTNGVTFDTAGGGFKILTSGQYLVTGMAFFSSPSQANVSYQSMLYKNTSEVSASYGVPPVASISMGLPSSIIISCAAGDELYLYAQTGATSPQTVSGAQSYLSIAMV